ncbi:MAG: SulP family inorganic anion transporter, partial [Ectothiorhodospiraceae bacterium]
MTLERFLPFTHWLRRSDRHSVRADAVAGVTGAVLALPQGVAYAAIAGLPPVYGLYTAIVTAVIAALFGSSRHLVSGPAAPMSIVVASIATAVAPVDSAAYLPYVLALTLLAGVFQLAFGLARLGVLVNFISHTVVVGFTAGAAVLIAASQIPTLLGLPRPESAALVPTLNSVAHHAAGINAASVGVGAVTLGCALIVRRLRPRWPSMLIAMLAGAGVAAMLPSGRADVAMVGAMAGNLPAPGVPSLSLDTLRTLTPGALALALIGLIEAVAIARAIGLRSGQRIDPNQEFIGQGLSNVVGSFFSCYAGSGSFTRSAANYQSGARTPLATVFAAVGVALVLLLAPQATAYLPSASVAAVVLLIAWNLVEAGHIRQIVRADRGETAVLLITFLATLFLALEFAIYVGVILSLVL